MREFFPKVPPEQQAIRYKCFHSSGTFVEFPVEEINQSIPDRFEKIVAAYSSRLAVKTKQAELTYSLPLTPNGKVDRKALPSPDRGAADLEQVYVAPRNTAEQIIAGIWAEILGRKRIGVHDNFFDLGGHSLKATQVVSRLRKVFRSEIPLRHLFEFPTIAEFAAVIGSLKKNTADENKLDRVLSEVAALSEAEAQRFLTEKLDGRRGEQQN